MKHSNEEYGSMATPCKQCDLEFAFQVPQIRIGWAGLPCKATPYTSRERFAINTAYVAACTYNVYKVDAIATVISLKG